MSDEEYERRAANRRANNALFAKWAREDRNQVIRELIEKALGDAAEICQERYLPDERAKVLRYLSDWLKSQMEEE